MLVSLDQMNEILSEDIVCVLCLRSLNSHAESSKRVTYYISESPINSLQITLVMGTSGVLRYDHFFLIKD